MLFSHAKCNQMVERIRRLFGAVPCRVQVAALPWRERAGRTEIMLITSRDTGRWVLPKGWPEGSEQLYQSAAREAAEEAGLAGSMAHLEIGSYFYAKRLSSGMERRCEVLVFPMHVDDVASKWPEQDERKREWFPVSKAAKLVREHDLGELIRHFGESRHKNAA